MALWFIADDGREVHKPPYTKAEQMAIYKSMADGPKVMMKHSGPNSTPTSAGTLDTPDKPTIFNEYPTQQRLWNEWS